MMTLDGLVEAALATNDEPLYGLECQESARDLIPFFSGFIDFLFGLGAEDVCLGAYALSMSGSNGSWRDDLDRNGFRTARAILSCSYIQPS